MGNTREAVGFTYESLRRTHERLLDQFHASVLSAAQIQRETSSLRRVASWVLRVSPMGWAAIRNGRMTYTNRSFDSYDRGSVIGPRWRRLAEADAEDQPGRTLQEVALEEAALLLAGGSEPRRQERFVRGPTIIEMLVERPVAKEDKGAALVLVRDVTDLVKAEVRVSLMQARMLEAERAEMAGELVMGVAHDLGNLVGALRARVVGLPDDPAYRLVTTAMQTIIEAQAALVNRLQSVAHPRSAPAVRLHLFKDVVQPAAQVIESSLQLREQPGKGPVAIAIDPMLLEEIHIVAPADEVVNMIINLFLNARDAMPDGGTIQVSVTRLFGGVQLRIEDEGTGIPAAHLHRIFEPLFSTKGPNGRGIGLATADALMRRLGGSISARNRVERGACFELTFVDPIRASY